MIPSIVKEITGHFTRVKMKLFIVRAIAYQSYTYVRVMVKPITMYSIYKAFRKSTYVAIQLENFTMKKVIFK